MFLQAEDAFNFEKNKTLPLIEKQLKLHQDANNYHYLKLVNFFEKTFSALYSSEKNIKSHKISI